MPRHRLHCLGYNAGMSFRRINVTAKFHLMLLAATAFFGGCSQDSSKAELGEGSIIIENATPQFKSAVDHHVHNPLSPFVYISWFPNPDSEELAEINTDGIGLKGWAQARGPAGPILSAVVYPTGLNEIHVLLKRLPPSRQNIPQHSAVILTFQNENGLETRVYDRFSLPTSVHRIWHIMTAPGMAMDCGPTTQS
jgi:hypothetical protein